MEICSSLDSVTAEAFEAFTKCIIVRIVDNWWSGASLYELFDVIVQRSSDSRNRFVLACLVNDIVDRQEILKKCLSLDWFFHSLNDAQFLAPFLHRVVCDEFLADVDYQSSLGNRIDKSSALAKALESGSLIELRDRMPAVDITTPTSAKSVRRTSVMTARHIEWSTNRGAIRNMTILNMANSFYVAKALRLQFFRRFNASVLETEDTVARLFRRSRILHFLSKPPKRFQLIPNCSPFCVPNRLIPLCCGFGVPLAKQPRHPRPPCSYHRADFRSRIPELTAETTAPKCLENWPLPPYFEQGLRPLVCAVFEATSPLFEVNILVAAEPLPCVGGFNGSGLWILTCAKLENGELVLKSTSELFCEFAFVQNVISGVYGESTMIFRRPAFHLPFSDVLLALKHRFVYRDMGLDIFTISAHHFTIIFQKNERRQFLDHIPKYSTHLPSVGPLFALLLLNSTPEKVMKLWREERISTYDYLMYLNVMGGRSFNDLAQYPIFPWTLGDFKRETPTVARDLALPMGSQNASRAEKFRLVYAETDPPVHYGTHYSHQAAVLHWMLRVQPYTMFSMDVHNGMDHKDRQFCSLAEAWRSASESNGDVKELIPEFYAIPYLFENVNSEEFGSRTDGVSLNSVALPNWARNATEFVWTMRSTLESPEVGEKIGSWIDLIFGCRQKGSAAVDSLNVFQPLCYEESLDQIELLDKGVIDAINHFGQCPIQLFQTQHPQLVRGEQSGAFVLEERLRVNQLKPFCENCVTCAMKCDVPCGSVKFEHYVGIGVAKVKIFDGFVQVGKTKYASVDECSCSCVSKDGLILAVGSAVGVLCLFSCAGPRLKELLRLTMPGLLVKRVAVSSHFGLVCCHCESKLCLIDYGSGFLCREMEMEEELVNLAFDEVVNMVVVTLANAVIVLGLDFGIIARLHDLESPVSCSSLGDSNLWVKEPVLVTGHVNGVVRIWKLDVSAGTYELANCCELCEKRKISVVRVIGKNRAVLVIAECGDGFLLRAEGDKRAYLDFGLFATCGCCGEALDEGKVCEVCGSIVCRKCMKWGRPKMCDKCSQSLRNRDDSRKGEESVRDKGLGSLDEDLMRDVQEMGVVVEGESVSV
jgi:hypothetical protein